jgi:hypothetical protein
MFGIFLFLTKKLKDERLPRDSPIKIKISQTQFLKKLKK